MLGIMPSVEKCAEACADIDGCAWFIFGKGDKAGRCYYEITTDGCEADGHPQRDNFDLCAVVVASNAASRAQQQHPPPARVHARTHTRTRTAYNNNNNSNNNSSNNNSNNNNNNNTR